jgi:hypothetical protein
VALPSLLALAKHFHITEREIAHRWPDGQWDDAAWEDCTFTAAVELARICWRTSIPANHVEVEKLRDVAGVRPTGGSNTYDARRGMLRRYGWGGSYPISGFSALWSALKPGYAALSQGTMAFPFGHRLRRWSPWFNGRHAVLIARPFALDKVWWCDPLAPTGTAYRGEWVTKAELKAYVDRLTRYGGRHIFARIKVPATTTTTTVQKWSVVIHDRTSLYSKINGTKIGTISGATYTCTRTKVSGVWWYRIVAGLRIGQAFKAGPTMTAKML